MNDIILICNNRIYFFSKKRWIKYIDIIFLDIIIFYIFGEKIKFKEKKKRSYLMSFLF